MRTFFLEAPSGGQRFCVFHEARGQLLRGRIVYLHAFAEEMNKARRMSAMQARALAELGFEVLQIDLLGCGDSSGDFSEATWQAWVSDALLACSWLLRRPGPAPLWLWGLRAGCLVATEALKELGTPAHLLLVQPPASGRPQLQQFLRLKLAGEMLTGANKGLMTELRSAILRREAVEVAGYTLHPDLAQGLESAQLQPPIAGAHGSKLVWLEVVADVQAEWTPVALQSQQQWRDAGYGVAAERVRGPAFWQTTEIEEAPALLEASCRLLVQATSIASATAPAPQEASA